MGPAGPEAANRRANPCACAAPPRPCVYQLRAFCLQELFHQKRASQILTDLEAWRDAYMAKHPEYFPPEVADAIRSGNDTAFDEMLLQEFGQASAAEADAALEAEEVGSEDLENVLESGDSGDESDEAAKEDVELDSIFNMIAKESLPDDPKK